jgi:acyl transferase domain-containing protein/phosphopantetheinyl transferase
MSRRPLDVAIIGMACRFPGARDLFAYWENLLAGRSAISDVPAGRWDPNLSVDPDSSESDRVTSRRGGYLDEPITFDAAAHGIMPRTVEGGELEQFLVLDAARCALADAGLSEGIGDGRRVEVVIGRGNYFNRGNLTRLQHGRIVSQTLGLLRALHPEWDEADFEAVRADLKAGLPPFEAGTIPGQLTNATAGRLANRFNLNGASCVVDAASASALTALALGASALVSRRADLAIVGGVYIEADVDFPMVFSRLGVLSRSGRSRPFSADADGMVAGEGVGVVVLKRLADAERDGTRVYAVVKGVGLASDGAGASLTALSALGHLRAIRRAYRQSRLDPSTVGLIEGHGLGVPTADRAELRALLAAFPPMGPGRRRTLGAASSLIGHAMPAAGMAGLIKAALSLFHRLLPPSPEADRPHPLLARAGCALTLNATTRPWIQGETTPRRAGVNAFGFAGINAHAVLEEHPSSADGPTPGAMRDWPDEAILLGAPDRASLLERVQILIEQVHRRAEIPLRDIAYTLNTEACRGPSGVRVGLVVKSVDDLIERLEGIRKRLADAACRSIRDGRGAYFWEHASATRRGLAFLFPGEGSQYHGMLADLCPHFPGVRSLFDTSDRIARESGATSPPSELVFGATTEESPGLWESGTAVNLVLSSQWALYQLLRQLGLRPDGVLGHSSGEFLSIAASGAICVDLGMEQRFTRLAAVFSDLDGCGTLPSARLVSVATDRARVESAFGQEANVLSIALDNCPHQVVVAGPTPELDVVVARLRAQGVMCEELPFARAYHTPAFESAVGPIREFFDSLEIAAAPTPLYSCCLAGRVPDDPEAIRRSAVTQWTRPVEFRRTVEAMYADGLRVFVDVGARGNLAAFVEDTLRGQDAFAVAANLPRRSGLSQLNHLVASLFAQGASLDPSVLYVRRRTQRVDLNSPCTVPAPSGSLKVGFPEMALSDELVRRLRTKYYEVDREAAPLQSSVVESSLSVHTKNTENADVSAEFAAGDDDAMLSHLSTMNAFLRTQREVMGTLLGTLGEVDLSKEWHGEGELPGVSVPHAALSAISRGVQALGESRNGFHPSSGLEDALQYRDSDDSDFSDSVPPPVRTGPWAGEVLSFIAGREVRALITLEASGDPVAENHTFGGRRVSAVNPDQLGLPVLPFTVMAEMLVDVAARLAPGRTLVGLREVRARRWIRYEDEPIALEVHAEIDPMRPDEVRAVLYNRGPINVPSTDEPPVVEGLVVFASERAESPPARPFDLGDVQPCRFTAHSIYDEQWLFHGPALRAVVGIGPISDRGIQGTLRVLPRRGLLRDPDADLPLTDPIVLDAYTHLLGGWGLDWLPEGDVIFPLRMGSLEIFGDDPAEGTDLDCRILVTRLERHRVWVEAEIVRPDGKVWMRIHDWEDWRFYWPSRYRDVFRQPDRELLGEPLALGDDPDVVAVWLEPPADMGRPVWRDVLEYVQLSPDERAGCLKPDSDETRRTLRLWGLIAAKEAARRLWLADGKSPIFPADLSIVPDDRGRPNLHSRLEPARRDLPSVSIAHTDGVAVAMASRVPFARIGIDVERIMERPTSFEESAFTRREREILRVFAGDDRTEWEARLWCAKQAAAKAIGVDTDFTTTSIEVLRVDSLSGDVTIMVETARRVVTARRGNYAWAWTTAKDSRS